MRIGLLGGSFDPAHEGHAHITREALKRFGLDEVWWLVSPGNPLKDISRLPSLEQRMDLCAELAGDPRIKVTGFEARHQVRYTADTVRLVRKRRPRLKFVWLMGADNLAEFHRWENWRDIMGLVPIAVMARPGQRISARLSPAARMFRAHKLKSREAMRIAGMMPPAWVFVNVPMSDLSSTRIRARGDWRSD